MAAVRHQQERRPSMVDGKRLGIAFGLALGLDHGFGPPGRTAPGGAALYAGAGGLAEKIEIVLTLVGGSPVSLASLLGLKDEEITLVAIEIGRASCRARVCQYG